MDGPWVPSPASAKAISVDACLPRHSRGFLRAPPCLAAVGGGGGGGGGRGGGVGGEAVSLYPHCQAPGHLTSLCLLHVGKGSGVTAAHA